MYLAQPISNVARIAFCVRRMVRFVNRRERWAKWTLAVIGVLALYLASFGPACWISSRANLGAVAVSIVYRPVTHFLSVDRGYGLGDVNVFWSTGLLSRFASRFAAKGWEWRLRTTTDAPDAHWQWCGRQQITATYRSAR